MKILFLVNYFSPEIVASAYLGDNTREAFANVGFDTELHTPMPSRGLDKETRKKYKKFKYEEQYDGRLKIHRFSMYKEPNNSLLRAFRYTLCIIRQLFNALGAKDVDVLFIPSAPPINGLMFPLIKAFKKYKIVYNLQDIFPDSLVNTGMTKQGSIIWKIGRFIENLTYKNSDKILVISEDFKKNIMEKGVPEDKISIVYNWVDENAVVKVERQDNVLFDKYNLDRDKFYICYSGNIGLTQNMEMLVNVASELQENKDIHFVIVGEGAYKPKLEKLIKQKNIENITLIPFQDYEIISHVFSLGDAGLIISKKGVGTNSVPSKTWSIMSAETPVLASFDKGSELDKIVTENECGICVEADDEGALKNAILQMYENRDVLDLMGKHGRQFILDNLTKEIGTKKIIDLINDVMGNSKVKLEA